MNHGHVTPNPDGSQARCGGPGICADCSQEAAILKFNQTANTDWRVKYNELVDKYSKVVDDKGKLVDQVIALKDELYKLKKQA